MRRPMKLKTLHAFSARKRSMKLVHMAKLAARPRADGSCGAASASSTQECDCLNAPSNGTPAPPAQEFVVMSAPGVSCSSTVASTSSLSSASDSAIASSPVHLKTHFPTCEEKEAADKKRAAVQQGLGATPATERKFQAMERDPEAATATSEGEKFLLAQMNALGTLLSGTPCQRCFATGMKVQGGTQLGLATKLELLCSHCGVVASSWSSARQDDSMAFDIICQMEVGDPAADDQLEPPPDMDDMFDVPLSPCAEENTLPAPTAPSNEAELQNAQGQLAGLKKKTPSGHAILLKQIIEEQKQMRYAFERSKAREHELRRWQLLLQEESGKREQELIAVLRDIGKKL
ncbi:hypothetical protein HPB49_002745 [Dermacentor silvarum]|uniref:Uncharacterized protein n=1 Tax=Dermacentor silvarum TaxID=543639 RepID=A0ACB8CD69_DERSI|nr:hypothetical protein HPB49_002745 [Dermacentor silvarum]